MAQVLIYNILAAMRECREKDTNEDECKSGYSTA